MADKKNNDWLPRFLATCLWGAMVLVILFEGNMINANDKENTKEHTEIRKEVAKKVDESKIEKITDKIEKILTKQERILTILEGMKDD